MRRLHGSLRLGGGGGVFPCPTTPKGEKLVDLELVRADGTGFKTFDATEDRVKTRIFITLLGQNMTSEGATGGFFGRCFGRLLRLHIGCNFRLMSFFIL